MRTLRSIMFFLMASLLAAAAPAPECTAQAGFLCGKYEVEFIEETGVLRITRGVASLNVSLLGNQTIETKKDVLKTDNGVRVRLRTSGGEGEFLFRQDGVIEFIPIETDGLVLLSDIHYAIVPGFFMVDLRYNLLEEKAERLRVPSENLAIGLLEGEKGMLVCAWPKGEQKITFLPEAAGRRGIEINTGRSPMYFSIFSKEGIWRREKLSSENLDRDVKISWTRPFNALWKVDLPEFDTFGAFYFSGRKHEMWRPVIGRYVHPVWFENGNAYIRLSRRVPVPPEREAVIYPLRGHEFTPLDFMGRCSEDTRRILAGIDELKDYSRLYGEAEAQLGRKYEPVGFTACGGSQLLDDVIYSYGAQSREKIFLSCHIKTRTVAVFARMIRLSEHEAFIRDMESLLEKWRGETENPAVLAFLDDMGILVDEMRQMFHRRLNVEEMTTASELSHYMKSIENRTIELLEESPDNNEFYPEFSYILGQYRRLRGIHEVCGKVFGDYARRLYMKSGLGCASEEDSVEHAESVRRKIREHLKIRDYEEIYRRGRIPEITVQ